MKRLTNLKDQLQEIGTNSFPWVLKLAPQLDLIYGKETLKGKTLLITGASRGIGLAMAKRAAQDGANIAILAKTAEPHPKLPGTIYTAAKELEELGGKALPILCDIRFEDQVKKAVEQTVQKFGGIDIVINNASAISITGTLETDMKKFDLMHSINTRGTFMVSKYCIPYLKKSSNPHILNISPPLSMESKWFAPHVAYTMAKFGMSLCVLGMSEELKEYNIAVNALWPRTTIATAAVNFALGGDSMMKTSRKDTIMADSAHVILTNPSSKITGNFFIDDEVLVNVGIIDLEKYKMDPSIKDHQLTPDGFV